MSQTFPKFELIEFLTYVSRNDRGPLDFLLEYDGVRYHFFLEYNKIVADCAENKYLQAVTDAWDDDGDDERIENASYDCLDLFWPFLREDYETRRDKSLPTSEVGQKSKEKFVVKIQVKTVNTSLQATEHDYHLKYPLVEPVENPFSDVKTFANSDVERLADIAAEIFKVRIHGTEYCLKTVYRSTERAFLRELKALRSIPCHPNIISLVGVVDAGEGKIDGLVLPYVSGTCLGVLNSVTESQRRKWKQQLTDVLAYLHGKGIFWGDAKAGNVMIDEEEDKILLIDFGGGVTKGWVDFELAGSKDGDLQGLSRILKYLDGLDTRC